MSANSTSSHDATRRLIRAVDALLQFFAGPLTPIVGEDIIADLREELASAKVEIGDTDD